MITLPMCPSANVLFPTSGRRRVKSAQYRAWWDEALTELARQATKLPAPAGCKVHLRGIAMMDNPRRDLSNTIKAVEDLLAAFFTFNDKQVYSIVWTRQDVTKAQAKIMVHVKFKREVLQ